MNPTSISKLTISAIRAFSDNYIWCIHNKQSAIVVDPGDHVPVLTFLQEQGLDLSGILITHHHSDHTGGIQDLLAHYPNIDVYGPCNPAISGITHRLKEHDSIHLAALDLDLSILETPGHTLDHIVYYNQDMLFCGDTLFSAGCGRMFEGTPEVFYKSLQKLAALPSQTPVYCTHEYTLANIKFAQFIEPDNTDLQDYANWVKIQREQDKITLPSSIAKESAINPFLRCHHPATQSKVLKGNLSTQVKDKTQLHIATFGALRGLKDNF